MTDSVPILPAASVLVIDDRPDLHVVIGQRRPGSIFVGGMIVFPGGGVDPDDSIGPARSRVPSAEVPELDAAAGAAFLHAAIRETEEEVGLDIAGVGPVDPEAFPHVGHWITPEGSPRRYDTHFFMARYRDGEIVPDGVELTDAWWERPGDVLDRIEAGDLEAIAPTIAFLEGLSEYRNVNDAFSGRGSGKRRGNTNGWTSM
ncbi:MAG: NUDIX domain-containing protein [Acidimicrobiales bacterium]|nr:NUDIX domain-containing protein [Acidimicrobiales bacterium]